MLLVSSTGRKEKWSPEKGAQQRSAPGPALAVGRKGRKGSFPSCRPEGKGRAREKK